MDNIRFILILVLGALSLLLYDRWQAAYGPQPEPVVAEAELAAPAPAADDVPQLLPPVGDEAAAPARPALTNPDATDERELVTLESDVLRLKLSPEGVNIVRAELKDYPIDPDVPERPVALLSQDGGRVFIAEAGILGQDIAFDHRTAFTPEAQRYVLSDDGDAVTARFRAQKDGLTVIRTVTLKRGSYLVDVGYEIQNDSGASFQGRPYLQLKRTRESGRDGFIYTFTGAALSTPEKHYKKYSFDDLEDEGIDATVNEGWVAFIQHYFLATIVPPEGEATRFYSKAVSDNLFVVGALDPAQTVAPGERISITRQLLVGPKLQDRLDDIAPHLTLAVDYGWVWFIAKPLFWLLAKIHWITGNWGIAIILVTFLLKLALFPLSAAGYRSMARMRKLQPRLVTLKERYEGDRQGLNQAMMELYKKEKVNPLGGCFPILIQIPVFLALYWVLLESVELRQASFLLWIDDLSSKDPFFVLPVLMGASMFFQQRLNPAPMDPMQARVMQIMPIAMTGFFAFFPSGLVLYWVANNCLSIAQQWYITRQIAASEA